jgi:hypothetical protein
MGVRRLLLAAALLLGACPGFAQTPAPTVTIIGRVVDATGMAIPGAKITLVQDGLAAGDAVSGEDGQFSVANVRPGPYQLIVSVEGFVEQTSRGVLAAGDVVRLPPIQLTVTAGVLAVDVVAPRVELAERQIHAEEQQRVLGAIPNFFVSYLPDAAPLTPRQKLQLSWKSRVDLFQFAAAGVAAGVQQARHDYSGFGDGIEGYAKRYGAAYATGMTHSLVSQVLLPSVFKQDPRYFYKGSGSPASRIGYAVSRTVVRKGDNGQWQPNYSGMLGSLASGALSNLYYPPADRNGLRLMLANTGLSIGGAAGGYLAQEFLLKRLTTHSRRTSSP